jgi:TonB family protein
MIAAWMLYCFAIAIAFVVVGEALERALHLARRATRWAWVAALAGSCILPFGAWLRPNAFRALPVPPAQPVISGPIISQDLRGAPPPPTRSFSLGDLDGALTWTWELSSAVLLLSLVVATLRLAVLRRGWRSVTVDGRAVFVSENVGPAVVGLWRPRVVLPEWARGLGDGERRLMLAHEDEHVRAGDPWLLASGTAVLILAPWNLALWWQVRRLRLAVEMDCDARVLAGGGDSASYGELLLRVGQRRARLPVGAPALGESPTSLERRIRRMAMVPPRRRWSGAAVALGIAVAAFVTSCEAPRPVPSGPRSDGEATPTSAPAPSGIADSVAWSVRDSTGSVMAEGMLRLAPNERVLDAPKLAHRIPGYDTLPVNNILLRAVGRVPTLTVFEGPSPAQFHGFVSESDRVREAALRYHPEVFAHPQPGTAIALVFDAQDRVIGHAAGVREAGDGDCLAVVDRLVPAFQASKWSSSGCADTAYRGAVIVYWKKLKPAQGAGEVSTESMVDERPVFLAGPPLKYPSLLRQAGIQGRVLVRAIIDTTGRAEPASVQVVESPHPGFNQAARNAVLQARFRHGRFRGRAVPVMITFPVDFRTGG